MRCNHLAVLFVALLAATASPVKQLSAGQVDLQKIDRKIVKEPKYRFTPHYALLVFGPEAKRRSWLVVDGDGVEMNSARVVYFDRNGNGDLTEPDERIELNAEATRKINMAKESGKHRHERVFAGLGGGSAFEISVLGPQKGLRPGQRLDAADS